MLRCNGKEGEEPNGHALGPLVIVCTKKQAYEVRKKEKAKREAIQDWLFLCTSKQAQIFNMSEQNTAEVKTATSEEWWENRAVNVNINTTFFWLHSVSSTCLWPWWVLCGPHKTNSKRSAVPLSSTSLLQTRLHFSQRKKRVQLKGNQKNKQNKTKPPQRYRD